jgi:hypothetical protein
VGTEFEGWTRDPDTREWRDAHGRAAYDANGQRIRYPDRNIMNTNGNDRYGPTGEAARPGS